MPSNLFVDTSKDFSVREYHSAHMPQLEPPEDFMHKEPANKPGEPSTAGLTGPELAEVNAWKDGMTAPTLANAITYVNNYIAYNAQADGWKIANMAARQAQWRILFGDALIYNKQTTSPSSDPSGSGSNPPPETVYPRNDP